MTITQWQYLESRPHPWWKKLYFKGKKLKANDVWIDMMVNRETPEEAAESWDLPLDTVMETIEYCKTHQELLRNAKPLLERSPSCEAANIPLANQFISLNQWNY